MFTLFNLSATSTALELTSKALIITPKATKNTSFILKQHFVCTSLEQEQIGTEFCFAIHPILFDFFLEIKINIIIPSLGFDVNGKFSSGSSDLRHSTFAMRFVRDAALVYFALVMGL